MAELSALDVLTNGGRKSIQQIQTSLDDDSILDLINSSKRQQLHFKEPPSTENEKSRKHKKKLKRLFGANHPRKTSDHKSHRESRRDRDTVHWSTPHHHKSRTRPNDPHAHHQTTQSAHTITMYSRSKSMPRIKTETDSNTPPPHSKGRIHRFAAWFDKLNHNVNTPSVHSEATSFREMVRQHSMKIITPLGHSTTNPQPDINSPVSFTDYSSQATNSPPVVSSPPPPRTRYMHQKIMWRPTLKDIYSDKQLLQALIAFMERIYCEENILFLQAVQQYKHQIDPYIDSDEKQSQIENANVLSDAIKRNIDFQIVSIYNAYIVSNAEYQVNLSYECFNNALARRAAIADITLHQKREIFDIAVTEIERLITMSVLSPFYDSAEFAVVATQRPQSGAKPKKSRNPFSRLRASSNKYKSNKYDDEMDEDSDVESEVIIDPNDDESVVSYDDDIDVPYSNSMPTTTATYKSSSLIKQGTQSPIKLYNAYEAEFDFPRRTNSGRSSNRYSSKSNLRSNVITPQPIANLVSLHNGGTANRSPDSQSGDRLSLTLSQSQTKSEFEFAHCNANSPKNRSHVISPRVGRQKDHGTSFHKTTMSDPDEMVHASKIQKLKDSKSPRKKYRASRTKAVRIRDKEKESKHKKHKKRKKRRKKKKKKPKKVAADDGDFMCKKRNHVKIGKLKDASKFNLRSRRKSNNDSDILLKLYREPRIKQRRNRQHDKRSGVDIV